MCNCAYDIMNCTDYTCQVSPRTTLSCVDTPSSLNRNFNTSSKKNGAFPSTVFTLDNNLCSHDRKYDDCGELQRDQVSSSSRSCRGFCKLKHCLARSKKRLGKCFCLFTSIGRCAISRQPTPFDLHPSMLLVLYMVYAFLTACCYFGWGSLSQMLFKSGAFAWKCETSGNTAASGEGSLGKTDEADGRGEAKGKPYLCDNQDAVIQPLFTVCMACHSIMTAFAGALLDEYGPKLTALLGQTLNTTAWMLLAFSSSYFVAYYPAFVFMGLGADTGYIPTLSIAHLFPQNFSLVITLMGASSTASFAVPLILEHIWNGFPSLTFRGICLLYVAFGTVFCGILAACFMPKKCFTGADRLKLKESDSEHSIKVTEPAKRSDCEDSPDCKQIILGETDSQEDTSTSVNSQNDASDTVTAVKNSDSSFTSLPLNKNKFVTSSTDESNSLHNFSLSFQNEKFACGPLAMYSNGGNGNNDDACSMCSLLYDTPEAMRNDGIKSSRSVLSFSEDAWCLPDYTVDGKELLLQRRHSSPACLSCSCGGCLFSKNGHEWGVNGKEHFILPRKTKQGCSRSNRRKLAEEGATNKQTVLFAPSRQKKASAKEQLEKGEDDGDGNVIGKEESISICVTTTGVNLNPNKMQVDPSADISFWKHFCSRQFLAIAVVSSVVQISTSFYQSSYSRSFSMSVVETMEIILPFSFIPCIILGKMIDLYGILPIMSLANTAGVLAYVFSLCSCECMHYASVFVFCVYISVDSDIIFCYVGCTFGSRHFGKLCGVAIGLGGVSSFMSYPLYDHLTVRYLNGNTTPVKIAILTLLCLMYCLHWYLWWWKRIQCRRSKQILC